MRCMNRPGLDSRSVWGRVLDERNGTTESAKSKGGARVSSLMRRANSLAQRGLYDEAIAYVKQAMLICPSEPKCSLQLASLYRAQNKIGPAIEAMKNAVALNPKDSSTQEQLLQVLIELGRYDEAINLSRKMLAMFPRSLFARDVLGIAYLQQGRIEESLQVANELIRLAPSDPAHHFKKAVLLQQKGEIAQAMEAFTRALQMDPGGDLADDAREAIAALDSYQLRQILTLAVEDVVFRTKLQIDPETATTERGFLLSPGGIATLRQIDLESLPSDSQNRYYH